MLMAMKQRTVLVLGPALLLALAGASALRAREAAAANDPRQEPPLVSWVAAAPASGGEQGFTGTVAAKVQSNLGFRVSGKIVQRLVDAGQQVKAGQPLMRIDDSDLRLAMTAKRNAIAMAQAAAVEAEADEKRYANLLSAGATSRQRYDQAKTALDTAEAQQIGRASC